MPDFPIPNPHEPGATAGDQLLSAAAPTAVAVAAAATYLRARAGLDAIPLT